MTPLDASAEIVKVLSELQPEDHFIFTMAHDKKITTISHGSLTGLLGLAEAAKLRYRCKLIDSFRRGEEK